MLCRELRCPEIVRCSDGLRPTDHPPQNLITSRYGNKASPDFSGFLFVPNLSECPLQESHPSDAFPTNQKRGGNEKGKTAKWRLASTAHQSW